MIDDSTRKGAFRGERGRRPTVILALLLLALGSSIYANSLDAPFVFDDLPQIVENPMIREAALYTPLSVERPPNVTKEQWSTARSRWLPVWTLRLNYLLGGLSVRGYHVVNLLIHLGCGLLLFFWLLDLEDRRARHTDQVTGRLVAFSVAAIFLAHPLQTQAVTYVVQRMTTLAAFFCLLSLFAYSRARSMAPGTRIRWPYYAASVVAFVAAMGSKESAALFPFVLALYEVTFVPSNERLRILYTTPHLLVSAFAAAKRIQFGGSRAADLAGKMASFRAHTDMDRLDYLRTQAEVVVTYLRLLVWPRGQNIDWDIEIRDTWPLAQMTLILVLIGCGILLVARFRHRSTHLSLAGFGILWFFLTLAVESSFIPIADPFVEHRLYLPSIGFFVFCLGLLTEWTLPRWRRPFVSIMLAVVALLGAATVRRNDLWTSPLRLWTDAASKSPRMARPLFNRGNYLREQGRLEEAKAAWNQAVERDPDHSESLNALGNVAVLEGDLVRALTLYRSAVDASPKNVEALYNLSITALRNGRTEEARSGLAAFVRANDPRYSAQIEVARHTLATLGPRETSTDETPAP